MDRVAYVLFRLLNFPPPRHWRPKHDVPRLRRAADANATPTTSKGNTVQVSTFQDMSLHGNFPWRLMSLKFVLHFL